MVVGPERTDRVPGRFEVVDDRVPAAVVETERRHPHVQPRTNRDRPLEERIQPVGLHFGAFGRQHRRRQRRILHDGPVVAAVAFDLVTTDAVLPPHERAAAHRVVALRRPRRQRRRRLHIALEAHDRRLQPLVLHFAEMEVGHAQLLERLEDAALVERARVLQLLVEPLELGVLDVDEREVEARDELAALFRQVDADRLRRLEALDVVAAETAVAA